MMVLHKLMRKRKQRKEFFRALGDGDVHRIRDILVRKQKLANHSTTPLVEASRNGKSAVVCVLLECGAHPNQRDRRCCAALSEAAKGNHSHIVSVLLQHGAKVDARSGTGCTALSVASMRNHLTICLELLLHGADVNSPNLLGDTALILAIRKNHVETVQLLLEHGADPNLINRNATTPLLLAMGRTVINVDLVRLLVEAGADVDAVDPNFGETCLAKATSRDSAAAVRLLLQAGADPHLKDRWGETPLCKAAEGNRIEIAQLLLSHSGACSASFFMLPLRMAIQQGSLEMTRLLLQYCTANVLLLKHAIQCSQTEILKLLMNDIDINARIGDTTPLFWAIHKPKLMQILLSNPAIQVNACNRRGETALWRAVRFCREESAILLLQRGAGMHSSTNEENGSSPFEMACKVGLLDVVYTMVRLNPTTIRNGK